MVSVQPSTTSPEALDLIIKFHSSTQEPVYISTDATEWRPQQMQLQGDAYEHMVTVPRSTRTILYKFRIGDSNWVHDGSVPAEPDGFWGYNNIFSIPEQPVAEEGAAQPPSNDFDEDTEVESVAAVESIADTASEAGESIKSNGEPELIDLDDVISDPDYPAFLDSRSSASSLPEWCGFGLRSRY